MKIRNGFVSNSSSSSFIIGYKGNKPTIEDMTKKFGVVKGSPFYSVAKKIAQFLSVQMNKENKITRTKLLYEYEDYLTTQMTEEEQIKVITKESYGELKKVIPQIFSGEYLVYEGSVVSDGDGFEQMLCEMGFEILDEDFFFIKGESY